VPAKVTAAPVWRPCRSIVLEGGAEMLESTMLVQDSTADEMEAYSVTTQADPDAATSAFEPEEVGAGVIAGISTEEEVWVVDGRVVFTRVVLLSRGVLVAIAGTDALPVIAGAVDGSEEDYCTIRQTRLLCVRNIE